MLDFDKTYTEMFNQCVELREDKMDYDNHSRNTENAARRHMGAVDDIVMKFHDLYTSAQEVEDEQDMHDLRVSFVDVFLNEVDALPWHEERATQKINTQAVDRLFTVIQSYVHDFQELSAIEDTFREKKHQVQGYIEFASSFPAEDKTVDVSAMHEMVDFCAKKIETLEAPAKAAKNAHFMKIPGIKH